MALADIVGDLTAGVVDLIATSGRSVTLVKRTANSYTPGGSDSLTTPGNVTIGATETQYATTAYVYTQSEQQPRVATIERLLKMIFNTAALGVQINQNDRVIFSSKTWEIYRVEGAFPESFQIVHIRQT
jgi:hypothetical protein